MRTKQLNVANHNESEGEGRCILKLLKPTSNLLLAVPNRCFYCGSFLLNVCFVGVFFVLCPIMKVSLFSYIWIPESPPIRERTADSFYHLSHLFSDVTSCCDFFPFGILWAEFWI